MTGEENKRHVETVQPAGWLPPKGYANGVVARGRTLYVAGQIGWNERWEFESASLEGQFAKALDNVIAVVRAAGGQPADVVRMTVYVTDVEAYRRGVKAIGAAWRERFGKHYPAMALVGVTALVEPRALVEIEATACLPEERA